MNLQSILDPYVTEIWYDMLIEVVSLMCRLELTLYLSFISRGRYGCPFGSTNRDMLIHCWEYVKRRWKC